MIRNKPYIELMLALQCFPRSSNAGYFIAPLVLKLAIDFGMTPYKEALDAWNKGDLKKAKVYDSKEEAIKDKVPLVFQWEGHAYDKEDKTLIIGLEETIKMIEVNVLAFELKRAQKAILKRG